MRNFSWKTFAVLALALAVLLGGSLAQAQTLPAPEGLRVSWFFDPLTTLDWEPVDGAARYELFVRGPGKWSPKKDGGWVSRESNVNFPDFPSHIIEGLVVGESYNFRVRAVNSDGLPGDISRKITFSPPPEPKMPKVSTTSDSISLSWNRKGIQTVTIQYYPTQDPDDFGWAEVKRGSSATLSGLLSDAEYNIDFSVNRKGHSIGVIRTISFTARTK